MSCLVPCHAPTQKGYGSFWISLSIILLFKRYEVYEISNAEVGCFLIG